MSTNDELRLNIYHSIHSSKADILVDRIILCNKTSWLYALRFSFHNKTKSFLMVTSFLLQPRRKSGRSCNSLMATLTAIQHDNQNKKDPQGRFGEELFAILNSLQVFVGVVVGWTRNMEARSISLPISSRTKSYAARGNWETNRALTAAALLMWSGWLFTKKREKERA